MRPGLFLLLAWLALLSGCRKDLIHPALAVRLETGTAARLNSVLFINDTLGFACGGPRFEGADVLITTDGGASWRLQHPAGAGKELFGLCKSPDGSVWAIGFDGQTLRTDDGGKSWRFLQLRYEVYKAMAFTDAGHFIAVGGISFERGDVMYADTTGGIAAHDSLGYELSDIVLRPDGTGWRCGYGAMQHTANGGRSWEWQALKNDNYTALDVHSSLVAFTCGGQGSICATHNGGATWQTLRNGNNLTHPGYRLQDLLFTDEQHGYAVGEEGVVIYSDDGGQHWSELERFTKANLHGIARGPAGSLYMCGEGGELWRIKL